MFASGAILLGAVAWSRANAVEDVDVNALVVLSDQIVKGVSFAALLGALIGIFVAAMAQHMKSRSGAHPSDPRSTASHFTLP
jgi:hypothetical protein